MQKEGSLPFNSQIEALRVLGRSIIKYLHCLVLTNRDINSRLRKTLYNLTADYLSGLGHVISTFQDFRFHLGRSHIINSRFHLVIPCQSIMIHYFDSYAG